MKTFLSFFLKTVMLTIIVSLFACNNYNESYLQDNTGITEFANDEILGVELELKNKTYGKQPKSDFYKAIFYSGLTKTERLQELSNLYSLTKDVEYLKWVIVYSENTMEGKDFLVTKNSLAGIGFGYLSKGELQFDLFGKDSKTTPVKSFTFAPNFTTRIFDHLQEFLPDYKSLVFLYNANQIKTKEQSISPQYLELEKNFEEMNSKYEKSDCGCQALPCCDIDGCGLEEDQTYCGWDDDGWGGKWYVCKSCQLSCIVENLPEDKNNTISKEDLIYRSLVLRDNCLSEFSKGQDYSDFYYEIGSLVSMYEFLSVHDYDSNFELAEKTLYALESFCSDGNDNEIILDEQYFSIIEEFINNYKKHYSDNQRLIEIFDYILSDLNQYKNLKKSELKKLLF